MYDEIVSSLWVTDKNIPVFTIIRCDILLLLVMMVKWE